MLSCRGLVNITGEVEKALKKAASRRDWFWSTYAMNITASVFINDDEPDFTGT